MFFYIFHHINHYVFKPKDKNDNTINVRTLIMGGIAYIILHAYFKSERMANFVFKDYFWAIFTIDVLAMCILYKGYYGFSILKTFGFGEKDKEEKGPEIQMKDIPKLSNNDNKSYFNDEIESTTGEGSIISETPTITSRKSRESKVSSVVDIDKILEDAKSM